MKMKRRGALTCLGLAMALVSGCTPAGGNGGGVSDAGNSSESQDGGVSSNPDWVVIDSRILEAARLLARGMVRCRAGGFYAELDPSYGSEIDFDYLNIAMFWDQNLKNPYVDFSAVRLEACITNLLDFSCPLAQEFFALCNQMFSGTLANGENCSFSGECLSGHCNLNADQGPCGICQESGTPPEPDAGPSAGLPNPDDPCDPEVPNACGPFDEGGMICSGPFGDTRCIAPQIIEAGGVCDAPASVSPYIQGIPGLSAGTRFCRNTFSTQNCRSIGANGEGTCQQRPGVGERCSAQDPCSRNLGHCEPDGEGLAGQDGSCQVPAGLGEPCHFPPFVGSSCEQGLYCILESPFDPYSAGICHDEAVYVPVGPTPKECVE
jgi:hypothetical protein